MSKKQACYALAAATVVIILTYAGRSVPRLVSAWVLVEKVELSPAKSISPPSGAGQDWVRLGEFASVSECAGIVKEKVQKDKQEGSQAAFEERNGAMAVTVYIKKETAPDRDEGKSNRTPEGSNGLHAGAESFAASTTKRVRYLECRETQRLESEPWIRRALRRAGIFL